MSLVGCVKDAVVMYVVELPGAGGKTSMMFSGPLAEEIEGAKDGKWPKLE